MADLKQSTTVNRTFNMVLASDHISPATAATAVVNLSKNGGAFGVATNSPATLIANGWYTIPLSSTDTATPGDLSFFCTATAADPKSFADSVRTHLLSDFNVDGSGNASIASNVKKNQALNGFMFLMTNSTTHVPQTGLTVTAQRSLAGAGFAPCANPVTELSNGVYVINLAATDTNANVVLLRFTATGADDSNILIVTQP